MSKKLVLAAFVKLNVHLHFLLLQLVWQGPAGCLYGAWMCLDLLALHICLILYAAELCLSSKQLFFLCFTSPLSGGSQWLLSLGLMARAVHGPPPQCRALFTSALHCCSCLCVWWSGMSAAQVTWRANQWGQDVLNDPGI